MNNPDMDAKGPGGRTQSTAPRAAGPGRNIPYSLRNWWNQRSRRVRVLLSSAAVFIGLIILTPPILYFSAGDLYGGRDFSRVILDREGGILRVYLSSDDKFRIHHNLPDFPPELIEALLLKEDRYFYSHAGVNVPAIFRAAKSYISGSGPLVGASTITMQLVRVRDGMFTRSLGGKLLQIFKALALELRYSKADILEAYLNLAPCGGNIEGFGAAAQYYFQKDPRQLSLSEILYLVIIPQNPGHWAPVDAAIPGPAREARARLYDAWIDRYPLEDLSPGELALPLDIREGWKFDAPHLSDYLNAARPTDEWEIRSTVDPHIQGVVEDHVRSYLRLQKRFGVNNAVVMLLDSRSMEVLAAVGSADYWSEAIQGQVNGFAAKRSPGSTLKPFIYAMAMDQGLIIPATVLKDAPANFASYTPDNYQSDFAGPVHAWEALVNSRNIPAIRLANEIRNPDLWEYLNLGGVAGLQDRGHYGLSIVLGSAEVSMRELVQLYSALANGGVQREAVFTLDPLENGDGTAQTGAGGSPGIRMMSSAAAYLTLDMLYRNPPPSQNRPAAAKKYPVAYKTGTSIGFKDAWSVGIFDRYILAMWIGNFDGEGNPEFLGRHMAAPLFFSIADNLLLESDSRGDVYGMYPPPDIIQVDVCSVSGKLPNDYCPDTGKAWFIPGVSPIDTCDIHREIIVDKESGLRVTEDEPGRTERVVREFWPSDILELFRQAGLPRLVPPPLAADQESFALRYQGAPPEFISPLENTRYLVSLKNPDRRQIALSAVSDSDSSQLFWFADSSFIGTSSSREILEWEPRPGSYRLTVADDAGRSRSMNINIDMAD